MIGKQLYAMTVGAAQGMLKAVYPAMRVDGKWGNATEKAFSNLPAALKTQVEKTVKLVSGHDLSSVRAFGGYLSASRPAPTPPTNTVESDFGRMVTAVSDEAGRRGLKAAFHVAQIAIETGWGKSIPKLESGANSWNYGGLKYASVRSQVTKHVSVRTREVLKGKTVYITDKFAVFDSPQEFARVYFWYLYDSPSSYRYLNLDKATSGKEFGTILYNDGNGYATDPNYPTLLANVTNSVNRRYSDLA